MQAHYDALETREPAAREAALLTALQAQVAHAQRNSPAFAQILQGVDASTITSRAALATLPVTRKHELLERQQAQRAQSAFGGFAAIGFGAEMQDGGHLLDKLNDPTVTDSLLKWAEAETVEMIPASKFRQTVASLKKKLP